MELFRDAPAFPRENPLSSSESSAWKITRWLLVFAACLTWFYRAPYLWDHYSSHGIVVTSGDLALTRWVIWSPSTLVLIWFFLHLSWGLLLTENFYKIGAVFFLLSSVALYGVEGLNMKAYDRLMLWQAFALLFITKNSEGIPVARVMLLMIYSSIYGSTGWLKILRAFESWWSGAALSSHLLERNFGNQPLGLWMVNHPVWLPFMARFTLIFEGSFPFLIWLRRVNPFVLIAGVLFHLGVAVTMNVGTFFWVSLAGYPVLLHPYYRNAMKANRLNFLFLKKAALAILLIFMGVVFFRPFLYFNS